MNLVEKIIQKKLNIILENHDPLEMKMTRKEFNDFAKKEDGKTTILGTITKLEKNGKRVGSYLNLSKDLDSEGVYQPVNEAAQSTIDWYKRQPGFTGPLRNGSDWIKKQKLSSLVKDPEMDKNTALAIGVIINDKNEIEKPAAVMIHKPQDMTHYFKLGLDPQEHPFYYNTNNGNKYSNDRIIIRGVVEIKDGVATVVKGKVDMNQSATLYVFK